MRHFIHWFFYLSLLSLFWHAEFSCARSGLALPHHARSVGCPVPYAIGYAPGTADWTPVSAPIQSTGQDFYNCDGRSDPPA